MAGLVSSRCVGAPPAHAAESACAHFNIVQQRCSGPAGAHASRATAAHCRRAAQSAASPWVPSAAGCEAHGLALCAPAARVSPHRPTEATPARAGPQAGPTALPSKTGIPTWCFPAHQPASPGSDGTPRIRSHDAWGEVRHAPRRLPRCTARAKPPCAGTASPRAPAAQCSSDAGHGRHVSSAERVRQAQGRSASCCLWFVSVNKAAP